MTTVLVIDDDPTLRTLVCTALEHAGYTAIPAADGSAGMAHLAGTVVDLVITDVYMPGQDGITTIRRLRREYPTLPVIAMSGGSRAGNLNEVAVALGARLALAKPFRPQGLLDAVHTVLGDG